MSTFVNVYRNSLRLQHLHSLLDLDSLLDRVGFFTSHAVVWHPNQIVYIESM